MARAIPTTSIRLSLLGPPAVESEDGPIHLGTRKALALLAYLAIRREPVLRVELGGLLWPEHTEERARRSLRQELSRLGQVLGSDRLSTGRERVGLLEAGLEVDVWAFTAARAEGRHEEAVAFYRGPLLQGLYLREAAAFETWIETAREALQRDFLESLSAMARTMEARGRYAEALAVLRQAIANDPLDEGFSLEAMRLAYRAGDRAGSLRIYQDLARALRDELDVEPSPEIRSVARDIAAGASPSPGLPAPTMPLVGREAELAEIEALLARDDCRLLTIVGPGGVGKTRVALELAARLKGSSRFLDGIYWMELRGAHLLPRLGDAFGLPLYGRGDLEGAIAHRLRNQRVLLVLDEGEDVTDAVSLERVLEACRDLKVLLTSRERLRLGLEWVYHLPGLPLPKPGERIEENSSVGLFLQAAERIRPGFHPAGDDWPAIAAICRLVAGLPLGLLLAASWLGVLSSREIQAELEQSLDLLEGALPHLPPRQRSLRAVIDSMVARLSAEERGTLLRLSVFAGGFTLAAARAVAGATPGQLAVLGERGLLEMDSTGRRRLLDLARQHVARSLSSEIYEVHALHFATFLEERQEQLRGGSQPAALLEIGVEHENLCAAWDWAAAQGRSSIASRMMESLFLFYELRGWFQQGADVFTRARMLPDPSAHSRALVRLGRFYFRLGRYPEAETSLEEGLAVARQTSDMDEVAFALNNLGLVAIGRGNPRLARERLTESLDLRLRTGSRWGRANGLFNLGLVAMLLGEYDMARLQFQEGLDLYRALGDTRGTSLALGGLGQVFTALGEYEAAGDFFRPAVEAAEELGDTFASASALLGAGWVEWLRGQPNEARSRIDAALQGFRQVGDRNGIARALLATAQMAARAGDLHDALRVQQEALQLAADAGFRWGEALALSHAAETSLALGDPSSARRLDGALNRAQDVGVVPLLLRVLLAASPLLEPTAAMGLLGFIASNPCSEEEVRTEARRRAAVLPAGGVSFSSLEQAAAIVGQALRRARS